MMPNAIFYMAVFFLRNFKTFFSFSSMIIYYFLLRKKVNEFILSYIQSTKTEYTISRLLAKDNKKTRQCFPHANKPFKI